MKKIALLIIICLIVAPYYLMDILPDNTPVEFGYWAIAILITNTIPLIYFFSYGYKKEIYPFLGVVGIFVSMSYALPVFFIHINSYQLNALTLEALQMAFWGYLTFYLAYFVLSTVVSNKKTFDPFKVEISNPKIKSVALFFLGIYMVSKVVSITAVAHIGTLGSYAFIGTYLLLQNKKIHISLLEKILFYGVLSFEFINRLLDGLLAPLALLILYISIIDFNSNVRITRIIILLIAFIVGFTIMSPIKYSYREIVWYEDKNFNPIERIEIILNLIDEQKNELEIEGKSDEEIDKNNFFWRYSYQASALSLVLSETPAIVPYWDGESYVIFSKFIPRFIWPDKPQELMGYKFGVRYGIMSVNNNTTSMNTPILPEMYMNFGNIGVIICMILFALIYVLLNNYFNNKHISDVGKVYAIAIIFPLVIQESNFSLMFGNIPLMILAVYGIVRLYINR